MKTETYTLPASWAGALINTDYSGMEYSEERELNDWLEYAKPGYCIGCSEESFFSWRNDATALGGDCLEFTFQVIA